MEGKVELVEKFGMKKLEENNYEDNYRVRVTKLPDGRFAIFVLLGNVMKATTNLWAKKIKKVDVTKENGYAFDGEFMRINKGKLYSTEIILNKGEVAVAVVQDGSWKNPGQHIKIFVALEDGIYTVSSGWETKADKIQTIHLVAEILNFLNSNK